MLKPFMRPPGEALPDRNEQALAYRALCRYFRLKYSQHSDLVAPEPNGDVLPISTGHELTVLTQAHHNPDASVRTADMVDVPQLAHFRYRALLDERVVRIVHPLDYAVDIDDAGMYPEENAMFLNVAGALMMQQKARGINFLPVGVEEINGLTSFLDQGEVVPHGGMNWEPTL